LRSPRLIIKQLPHVLGPPSIHCSLYLFACGRLHGGFSSRSAVDAQLVSGVWIKRPNVQPIEEDEKGATLESVAAPENRTFRTLYFAQHQVGIG
jgi:hypothetical protein